MTCNRCGGLGYVLATDGLGTEHRMVCPCTPPSSTREKPQEPVGTGTMFHWRDYIFFGMKDDGTVRIKQYANNIPPASPPWADEPEHQIGMVFDISIPAAEWQSILCFTAPGLIKDRKSIVAMTGLLAQARRERDTALSAIARIDIIEECAKAVEDAGGDNEHYHAAAVRALKIPDLAATDDTDQKR